MVTRSPRDFSRLPRLEAVRPLPSEEATPPVTKTCLVGRRRCFTGFHAYPRGTAPSGTRRTERAARRAEAEPDQRQHGRRPGRAACRRRRRSATSAAADGLAQPAEVPRLARTRCRRRPPRRRRRPASPVDADRASDVVGSRRRRARPAPAGRAASASCAEASSSAPARLCRIAFARVVGGRAGGRHAGRDRAAEQLAHPLVRRASCVGDARRPSWVTAGCRGCRRATSRPGSTSAGCSGVRRRRRCRRPARPGAVRPSTRRSSAPGSVTMATGRPSARSAYSRRGAGASRRRRRTPRPGRRWPSAVSAGRVAPWPAVAPDVGRAGRPEDDADGEREEDGHERDDVVAERDHREQSLQVATGR